MLIVVVISGNVCASAEEGYTPSANTYTDSMTDSAKTVIIYKGTAESDIADIFGFGLYLLLPIICRGTYTNKSNNDSFFYIEISFWFFISVRQGYYKKNI